MGTCVSDGTVFSHSIPTATSVISEKMAKRAGTLFFLLYMLRAFAGGLELSVMCMTAEGNLHRCRFVGGLLAAPRVLGCV